MRTDLGLHARQTLAAAEVTRAEWTRQWWGPDATTWRGDLCGCSDDRCIGYHHDEGEDCLCLPAMLTDYLAARTGGATGGAGGEVVTGVVMPRRVHVPAGTLPSGQRVRAACSCGWVSSPRVDERRAVAALESEHGYQDARCDVCGRDRDAVDVPWADRYRHLHVITDPMTGDQFLACSDDPETCHALAAARHSDPAPATGPAPAAARPRLQVIAGGRGRHA